MGHTERKERRLFLVVTRNKERHLVIDARDMAQATDLVVVECKRLGIDEHWREVMHVEELHFDRIISCPT